MSEIYTHGFIGIGKMAQVILGHLIGQGQPAKKIIVSRRSLASLKRIKKEFRVAISTDNREAAASVKFLWLGIKPQQALEVLSEIQPFLNRSTVVISMMAGVTTKTLQKILGRSRPIVRLMPNTPAKFGQGATGLFFTKTVSKKIQKELTAILQKLGQVFPLKREAEFHALTGLSGSGPAYIYTVAKGLIDGGVAAGLTRKQSRELTVATLKGAAEMLANTETKPETLIEQVASKKGTTEAGLQVLKKKSTAKSLEQAVRSAARRSEQITRSLQKT